MIDQVSFQGIRGLFNPCDGRHHFKNGDYFRLPNGEVFHITTDDSPFKVVSIFLERPIPFGTKIFDVVRVDKV